MMWGMNYEYPSDLVNLRELARRLRKYGLTQTWLRAEVNAGRIPHMRAGRRLLFNVTAVEQTLLRRAAEGMNDD